MVKRNTLLNAFKYNHKSGDIKATYDNNGFTIETSATQSFSILISPDMMDINKPVSIILNGKLYSKQIIKYDSNFMIENFEHTLDRKAVWINDIDVNLE